MISAVPPCPPEYQQVLSNEFLAWFVVNGRVEGDFNLENKGS